MREAVDDFMEGTRPFGGSRVTHWLPTAWHGERRTACGTRLGPATRFSRSQNEADCKRCLAARVPDFDEGAS